MFAKNSQKTEKNFKNSQKLAEGKSKNNENYKTVMLNGLKKKDFSEAKTHIQLQTIKYVEKL